MASNLSFSKTYLVVSCSQYDPALHVVVHYVSHRGQYLKTL